MDGKAWAAEIADKILCKEKAVVKRVGKGIPYTVALGKWDDFSERDICWWTNGFWAGLMWQLYGAFGDTAMRKAAENTEIMLDRNLMLSHGMDHDSGFKWLLTSGANLALTGSTESRNRLILAADNLAGRFNPIGRFIRAWNDCGDGSRAGTAIIDCMMNLPLLYKATDLTHDPRYKHIAVMHADTVLENFVRHDGSVCHIVEFDPESGKKLRSVGGQGYDCDSAWTRGQAWALYGFTLSYKHTGKSEYIAAAKKVADNFLAQLPESGLVPIDFYAPDKSAEDSSAAAIAACGLIELRKESGCAKYGAGALKLLESLNGCRCDYRPESDNIVEKCSVAYHGNEHDIPLIYADYFYTEAILKLCDKETFLW